MIFTDEFLASFDASTTDVATACTLPPEIYTDEAFLAFERRALFSREWLCVGLASQIPEPGDYVTTTANGEPIIVARGKDAVVRAFSAVCRHRGMQVADDAGNCRTFTCPYHQWAYALDGRLLGAPAMERTVGFDKQQIVLPTLAVEEWQGFVFVNFDTDAAPLGTDPASLRALPRALRAGPGRLPGHVHPHRPAVELEGDVRELQRRLPRQPAAPHDPGLLSQSPRRVPGAVGRRLQRDLPHQRLHPHRRRLQRHDQGAVSGVPTAHRGGALAQHVRAGAADAVHRDRARPGVLLHRPTRRRSTRSTSRSAISCIRARWSTRCSSTCSR